MCRIEPLCWAVNKVKLGAGAGLSWMIGISFLSPRSLVRFFYRLFVSYRQLTGERHFHTFIAAASVVGVGDSQRFLNFSTCSFRPNPVWCA